jgi:hypothetical protein
MPVEGLMNHIFGLIVFAAALLAGPAAAKPDTGLAGVWQGTLGAQPVRVCFNTRESGSFGQYFYLRHLVAIPLQQPDDGNRTFVEGYTENDSKAARWTIDAASGDRLAGNWTQVGKKLPIVLARVPGTRLKEDETPCGSMAFQQPRLEGVRTIAKPAIKDGVRYTRLILDHRGRFGDSIAVESFALAGDTPATRKINAALRKPLAGEPDGWLACVRMAADASPNAADNLETYEPRLFSRRWLVVMNHWDGFCGGAHPDSSNAPMVFDLTTGAEVEVFDWFSDKAVKREPVEGYPTLVTLQPQFRSLVLGRWKGSDADCDDAIRTQDYWHAELTRTGFTFTPDLPHVVQACGENFAVPFASLQPYLNDQGKAAIATLR